MSERRPHASHTTSFGSVANGMSDNPATANQRCGSTSHPVRSRPHPGQTNSVCRIVLSRTSIPHFPLMTIPSISAMCSRCTKQSSRARGHLIDHDGVLRTRVKRRSTPWGGSRKDVVIRQQRKGRGPGDPSCGSQRCGRCGRFVRSAVRSVGVDNQHRARGTVGDRVRDAPEQAASAGHAAVADDDEVCVDRFGDVAHGGMP